ncbi:MAG TPA: glycosyltransferase family 2 protein [Thermoanaerobaculia bacterium]|nr:glycosyltransferase family 2 protein [Thermoanaerobaculia bacterium]
MRVVAIISAFNEGDIIAPVLEHLVDQGVEVYLIDNLSTDDTVEQARRWEGRGLIGVERFPPDAPGEADPSALPYDWTAILLRKEQLARELEADWFIHHDADELREPPWPGATLRDAIAWVDGLGYNAISFRLLNFVPVDEGFRQGVDPSAHFTYFEEGKDYDRLQVKCWKNQGQAVALAPKAGHDVSFPGRRVFPVPFLLRHYPIRSSEHGRRKVFAERKGRFTAAERAKRWHIQYDAVADDAHRFLGDPTDLTLYSGDHVRLETLLDSEATREARQRAADAERQLESLRAERDRWQGLVDEMARSRGELLEQLASLQAGIGDSQRLQELAERLQATVESESQQRALLQAELRSLHEELQGIHDSRLWRLGRRYWALLRRLGLLRSGDGEAGPAPDSG